MGLSARMWLSSARLSFDRPVRGLKGALSEKLCANGWCCAGRIPVESYMTNVRSLALLGLCLLVSCIGLAAHAPQPTAGHAVSGTYTIAKSSEAGSDTQVTLNVRLTSGVESSLQSVEVGLRSVLTGTTQQIPASFSIPPQGNADFTATVTIPQAEIKLWQRGAWPTLILKLQPSDGSEFTLTLSLQNTVREAR